MRSKRIALGLAFLLLCAAAVLAQTRVRVFDPATSADAVLAVDATKGQTAKTTGPQFMCAADTTVPSAASDGQAQQIACDVDGRVITRTSDPCSLAKTLLPISQTGNTQLFAGTSSMRTYVCGLILAQPSASTQTFSLVSGTGSVCATSTGAMIGATTAGNGVQLPFAVTGATTIAKSDTDADNVCLFQSGSDRIAGVISYVVAAN